MDRRTQTRSPFTGPAKVKLLNSILGRGVILEATILDVSGGGMRVRIPRALPCGTPVEVDAGDRLALGEICRCEPVPSAEGVTDNPAETAHIAGVAVSQTLASLSELERFNRLLDEFSGKRPDTPRSASRTSGAKSSDAQSSNQRRSDAGSESPSREPHDPQLREILPSQS